jgi:hypothetical protein
MKYWAKLDNNRIVTEIIVAEEEFIMSGQAGSPLNFIETSLDGSFRKNYAGIDYSYDYPLNCFIPPKPSDAIGLDTNTCLWILPPSPPSGSIPITGSIIV